MHTSTYCTAITQATAQLSAATGSLQTQLDNLLNARITLAAQLITQNAAIGATQTWEQHEKLVNELEIRIFMQDSVNSTQLALLDALGTLCPDDNGEAVLRAQVLYNRFVEKEFSPVCTGARGEARERTEFGNMEVSSYSISPNPSTGIVTITNGRAGVQEIQVFDVAGRIVHQLSTSDTEIDLSDLNNGLYFLRIKDETTGKIGIARLIINK